MYLPAVLYVLVTYLLDKISIHYSQSVPKCLQVVRQCALFIHPSIFLVKRHSVLAQIRWLFFKSTLTPSKKIESYSSGFYYIYPQKSFAYLFWLTESSWLSLTLLHAWRFLISNAVMCWSESMFLPMDIKQLKSSYAKPFYSIIKYYNVVTCLRLWLVVNKHGKHLAGSFPITKWSFKI